MIRSLARVEYLKQQVDHVKAHSADLNPPGVDFDRVIEEPNKQEPDVDFVVYLVY